MSNNYAFADIICHSSFKLSNSYLNSVVRLLLYFEVISAFVSKISTLECVGKSPQTLMSKRHSNVGRSYSIRNGALYKSCCFFPS